MTDKDNVRANANANSPRLAFFYFHFVSERLTFRSCLCFVYILGLLIIISGVIMFNANAQRLVGVFHKKVRVVNEVIDRLIDSLASSCEYSASPAARRW